MLFVALLGVAWPIWGAMLIRAGSEKEYPNLALGHRVGKGYGFLGKSMCFHEHVFGGPSLRKACHLVDIACHFGSH